PTPEERLTRSWDNVHKKLIEMAEDFPEELYTYKAHPDVRSFGEELLHVAAANTVVAEIAGGREGSFGQIFGEISKDFEYTSKADTVAKLKKSVEAVAATVKGEDKFRLISLLEHAGEHYGKLVIYYRNNGLVPPSTRRQQARRRQQQQQQTQKQNQ
ncbi:MAG: DinB family protein, partial [Terriglobia bacterium]